MAYQASQPVPVKAERRSKRGNSPVWLMRWVADVRIAGPIGSMGQRVFQPIVNQQVTDVLSALEQQVAEARDGG